MINEFEIIGEITKAGKFSVYNIDALNQYFSEHKGERIILKIVPCGTNSTKRLISYYKNVMVPAFQKGYFEKGYFYSCEKVDELLREMSPLCQEEYFDDEKKVWVQNLKDVYELNTFNLTYFIAHLKLVAAEDFCIFIAEPKTV